MFSGGVWFHRSGSETWSPPGNLLDGEEIANVNALRLYRECSALGLYRECAGVVRLGNRAKAIAGAFPIQVIELSRFRQLMGIGFRRAGFAQGCLGDFELWSNEHRMCGE